MTFADAIAVTSTWFSRPQNIRKLLIGGLSLAVAVLLWVAYDAYRDYRERKAHAVFTESVYLFNEALVDSANPHRWNDIIGIFERAYENNKSSILAPYFRAYLADSMVHGGKTAEAIELLDAAVKQMKAPFASMYATKLAILKIDHGDDAAKAAGLAALDALGRDVKNPVREVALYYRGLMPYVAGNVVEAEIFWTPLMREFGAGSFWAQKAAMHLGRVG